VILALGEFLPMSQGFIGDMSLGMGRHRVLAIVGILEVTASIVLGLLFASPWGLAGVCIGFTVPGVICRGVFRWWYGGHLVSVGFREYMRGVILPVIGAALMPGIALALVVNSLPLESWPALALCALGFIALYTISFFLIAAREELHRFQVSEIHAA
jgi:hypothetical protein